MTIPAQLMYTHDHEWLAIDGELATVGVTAHAADALGDVVYVELPQIGAVIRAGESFGEIESTKSVSDLYGPVEGEVVATNGEVVADPSLVNSDPYGGGWLIRIRTSGSVDLLDAVGYAALVDAPNGGASA